MVSLVAANLGSLDGRICTRAIKRKASHRSSTELTKVGVSHNVRGQAAVARAETFCLCGALDSLSLVHSSSSEESRWVRVAFVATRILKVSSQVTTV